MEQLHVVHDRTYGSPRMAVVLKNLGFGVNQKRIERLLRQHRIVGVHKPAKKVTTVPAAHCHCYQK